MAISEIQWNTISNFDIEKNKYCITTNQLSSDEIHLFYSEGSSLYNKAITQLAKKNIAFNQKTIVFEARKIYWVSFPKTSKNDFTEIVGQISGTIKNADSSIILGAWEINKTTISIPKAENILHIYPRIENIIDLTGYIK